MAYFIWPVPGFPRVTSKFRTAERPNHLGIDIGRNVSPHEPILRAEVVAVASGRVAHVGYGVDTGHVVAIDHGGGIRTRYMHLYVALAGIGGYVKQGEVIALVGDTGRSSAPHLHFEFIVDGAHRDPMDYLDPLRQEPAVNGLEFPHLPNEISCVALDLPVFAEGTAGTGNAFSAAPCRDAAAAGGRGVAGFLLRGLTFLPLPGRAAKFLARLFGPR